LCVHDPPSSRGLGLERADGGLDEILGYASSSQVVTDQRVSGPSLGEDLRPASRQTLVVDGAGANQATHGLAPCSRSYSSP
jgi:hypothetical protein